ncbi:MAG: YfiR family protein [Chitinophagales bacterium]
MNTKTYTLLLLFFSSFFLFSHSLLAMEKAEDLQVTHIYKLTKYIHWPDVAASGNFVIGIIGNTEALDAQSKDFLQNKTIEGLQVQVQVYNSVAEIENPHILFITEGSSNLVDEIAAQVAGKSVLTIGNTTTQQSDKLAVQFIELTDRVEIILNQKVLTDAKLVVEDNLKELTDQDLLKFKSPRATSAR